MFKTFNWAGESIDDIEKWAWDRCEKMIDITWKKKEVFNGNITYYEEKDTMPESFWRTFRITEQNGTPIKVTKRKPRVKGSK
jgi:hypothetical protein